VEVVEAAEVVAAEVVAGAVADLAFHGHRARFSRTLAGGLTITQVLLIHKRYNP